MRLTGLIKKIIATSGAAIFLSVTASAATNTSTRPQLSSTSAKDYTVATYMASFGTIGSLTTDNWDPTAGVEDSRKFAADYKVASDGTAQYRTVQSAINAAVAAGGVARKYISVKAGTYTELVCVPSSAPPITLYGLDPVSGDTVIAYGNANPTPAAGARTNQCVGASISSTIGTLRSSTVAVLASNFQARNLTFENSYVEGTYASSNQSAVALAISGDKAIFENVSIIGNQDTLYVGAPSITNVIRAYFTDSFIQGDTDFIFGPGTAAFNGCTIQYTATRLGPGAVSFIFAPSTSPGNPYGFLAINSTFNFQGAASNNSIYLGRAWDEGVPGVSGYINGTSANGQVVVRDSTLAGHIRIAAPWGASTAARPYCSENCAYSANRFSEYNNAGAGS